MKDTLRLNFAFPQKEYVYLKMMCAHKRTSIKDYASQALINRLEDDEDDLWAVHAEKELENLSENDLISWDEVKKELEIEL